jgi:bifunctional non-homologous end joining protein LigD
VLAEEAASLPDTIIDGEIVALDENGAPNFAALQAALSEQNTGDWVFYVFDLLFEGHRRLTGAGAGGTEGTVADIALRPESPEVPRASASWNISTRAARLCCVRRASSRSRALSRSERTGATAPTDSWTKAKCRAGHEVVIGGWSATGSDFRSLLVGVHRAEYFVYVGRVGTGFKQLLPRLKAVGATKSPFTGVSAPRNEPWPDIMPSMGST